MLSCEDHNFAFGEVQVLVDSNSSNKYNTCTSFFVFCVVLTAGTPVTLFLHFSQCSVFFVPLNTVTGTKTRMNIVGCRAANLSQLPRASDCMTVYLSSCYGVFQ